MFFPLNPNELRELASLIERLQEPIGAEIDRVLCARRERPLAKPKPGKRPRPAKKLAKNAKKAAPPNNDAEPPTEEQRRVWRERALRSRATRLARKSAKAQTGQGGITPAAEALGHDPLVFRRG